MFGGDVPLAWAHCLFSLASPPPVLNWGLRPCRDVTVQAPAAHGPVIRCRTMMPFSSQARRSFFSKKNKVLEASPDFCCGFSSPSGVWFVPALQRCRRALTEMPAPMDKTPDAAQGCHALGRWPSRCLSMRHHLSTGGFCSCE